MYGIGTRFVYTLHMITRLTIMLTLLGAFAMPNVAAAAESFELSAWIPYWRSEAGVESIMPYLDHFTEVNPFIYTVKNDGSLNAESPLSRSEWQQLKSAAAQQQVRFIPTITWSGGETAHAILSDPESRREHIRAITREVYAHDLDGIDIDYEGKFARTRPYFSLFLKELQEAIGYDRFVTCTIEARTPLDSRYSSPADIPSDIEYANEFADINRYCDHVRIMAYDQGRFDIKLAQEKGHPYVPVADTDWVEKVMRLTMEDINAGKLSIGVATYGYEYDMFTNDSGNTEYSRLWSFNPGYATDVAEELNIEPQRNSAGELFLTYPASDSPDPVIPLPYATRVMSWSDTGAVQEKITLAQELGVNGVSVFKIDGGQDPTLLDALAQLDTAEGTAKQPGSVSATQEPSATPGSAFSAALPSRDLYYGMRNEDVRTLQQYLNTEGFTVAQQGGGSPGNETTFFGPATRAALARYQEAHNISPAVGYYGPITRSVAIK